MFLWSMSNKASNSDFSLNVIANHRSNEDNPLKFDKNSPVKVDINVLKARIQAEQNKENKKNISIFIFLALGIGVVGILFSV
jgi:hypothetical protein